MRQNKLQAAFVTIVIVGVAYTLALLTGNLAWTLFYFTLFLLSLHRYFFQTDYRLTQEQLLVKRPWRSYTLQLDEFRSFTETENGIQLNRMGHDSFSDRLRGVYILTGSQHSKVIEYLQTRIQMA